MARKKRFSPVLDAAVTRKAAMTSIDAALDLSNGLTLTGYQAAIDAVKTTLDEYNTLLSTVDDKLNELEEKELLLKNWNERMLNGVASKYGKDSTQYEMAGGKRKSDIKRSPKKKKAVS
jgi:uncharacterized protein YukE